MMRAARYLAIAAALAILGPLQPARAEPDPAQVTESLRRATEMLAATGRHEVAGQWLLSSGVLPRLYARTGFRLLWHSQGGAEGLLGEIAASEGDGLSPSDYHFNILISTLERRRAGPEDVDAAVDADLLLSDALVRLAAHLRLGKLRTDGTPRWDLPERVEEVDAVEFVLSLMAGGQVAGRISELRPAQTIYGRYKAALARYRIIAADAGWPFIGPGPTLALGQTDTRVATVRRRLSLTGDYLGTVTDDPTYDGAVMSAVQSFQRRHGLETDGLLGPATRRALNLPVEARIEGLRANLERARQLLSGVRGRFVLIDPAAGEVVAAADNSPADVQPADFGPGYERATPFRSRLEYFVINPDWTLPPSLVESQVRALARRSAGRFEDLGLSVLAPDGRRLDPARADWSNPGSLVVRQAPGETSFLGTARLHFPNAQGLTIHGRGGGGLAGMVSVPDPLALLSALLAPAYDRSTLEGMAASGRSRTLMAEAPVAVIFSPWTAWVAVDGSVSFRPGFEDADALILEGLAARAGP